MSAETSGGESDDDMGQPNDDGRLQFVLELKKHSVLLEKSQTPDIRRKKEAAMSTFLKDFEGLTGTMLTPKQVRKKINNAHTDVRKKMDAKRTGNRKVVLKPWEKEFLGLVKLETNPTFCKIPGGEAVGASSAVQLFRLHSQISDVELASQDEIPGPSSSILCIQNGTTDSQLPPPPAKKNKVGDNVLEKYETQETKKMTTTQLHRLLLLEQLKLIRMKQERLG